MSPYSTSSTKSLCLTLALVALAASSSSAAASAIVGDCDSLSSNGDINECSSSSASFGSATIIKRLPIHLQPLTSNNDENEMPQRNINASVYHSANDHDDTTIDNAEDEFELPAELAAMIQEAKYESSPAAAPTLNAASSISSTSAEGDIRYYATYAEGESCSSKSIASFESWEESHASLEDCCDVAFSWDYDSCMGTL
mmetsp:Transcript_13591/g.29553  ORF Transcript_13591/g.29553 Transcript_13591/m.29553 type:complete len:199 (+) Transcript_13591:127-723(+)